MYSSDDPTIGIRWIAPLCPSSEIDNSNEACSTYLSNVSKNVLFPFQQEVPKRKKLLFDQSCVNKTCIG